MKEKDPDSASWRTDVRAPALTMPQSLLLSRLGLEQPDGKHSRTSRDFAPHPPASWDGPERLSPGSGNLSVSLSGAGGVRRCHSPPGRRALLILLAGNRSWMNKYP